MLVSLFVEQSLMSRPLINNQVSIISIPGQGYMTYNTYTWTIPSAITLPGGIKRENTYLYPDYAAKVPERQRPRPDRSDELQL